MKKSFIFEGFYRSFVMLLPHFLFFQKDFSINGMGIQYIKYSNRHPDYPVHQCYPQSLVAALLKYPGLESRMPFFLLLKYRQVLLILLYLRMGLLIKQNSS